MIPVEILTMGVSVITGIAGKVVGTMMDNKRLQHQMFMQSLAKDMEVRDQIQNSNNERMNVTRQIIALTSLFSIVVFPKVVWLFEFLTFRPAVYFQEVAKTKDVSFWFWHTATTKTEWIPVHGVPVTQLDIHIMMAVIGLYLGASIAGRN